MKASVIVVAVCGIVAGCENSRRELDLATRSHSFEPKLFVADMKVPHLEKAEWEEIREQFERKKDYVFRGADRLSVDVVKVSLELKSDRYKGIQLRFERTDGHWRENASRAEKVDYLIP